MALVLNNFSLELEESKVTGILTNDKEIVSKKIVNEIDKKRISYGYNKKYPNDMLIGLTVREELSLALQKYNYRKETINKKCIDALSVVALPSNLLERKSYSLSSGEKKLLTIAINLITNPKIIVLDNPNLYLDDTSKKKLAKVLKKITKRYNKIVIIISNNINYIYNTCDKDRKSVV